MHMLIASFALLSAALIVFVWSTKQYRLATRTIIWVVGLILLILAGFALQSDDGENVVRLISIALEEKSVRLGLLANLYSSVAYFTPWINILFVITVIVAVVAVLAFTPGEAIERNLRSFSLVIVGMILGAGVTIGLVAVGFGGHFERALFVGYLTTKNCDEGDVRCGDVIDGDTIAIGDTSLRLSGIDAVERASKDGKGIEARNGLVDLLEGGRLVICYDPDHPGGKNPDDSKWKIDESFGRPVVGCWTWKDGRREKNLALEMAKRPEVEPCQKTYKRKENRPDGEYWSALAPKRSGRVSLDCTELRKERARNN